MQKCLNNFSPNFRFQDTLKRKAEYLTHCDNNDNPERKRQKNGTSANEQLNTLVTECCKNDANTARSVFWVNFNRECAEHLGQSYFKAGP